MTQLQRHLALARCEREWTRQLVAALPERAFDWRPADDAFSCGELVLHLIQAERFWRRLLVQAASGRAYDPLVSTGSAEQRLIAFRPSNLSAARRPGLPTTFAACLTLWAEVAAETTDAFAAFTETQLAEVIVDHPLTLMHRPLGEMLQLMVSHEVHHRGQLSAYAKMMRLPQPPLYADDGR